MADDRDGYDRCYGAAGLEGGTDGEAVHEAVPDQAGRGEYPDARMVLVAGVFGLVAAVYRSGALDYMQRQEAGHGGEHDHWHAEQVLWLLAESLGQQIEQHHAEHQPRSQAQH